MRIHISLLWIPISILWIYVAPGFKDKIRYIPYVCPGIQFTHIATNEGVISKTMPLLHSAIVFVTKDIVLLYSIY